LIDVPRLASVRKGDTIVTGMQSEIFPENINIGTIEKVYIDNKTNYYTLDIKLFNDMTNLGHVYVLKSKYRDELNNLEKERKMNSTLLVNIFRFILLLAVQIVIFNNMNFLDL
jgi:rod shape-determining protein MreC